MEEELAWKWSFQYPSVKPRISNDTTSFIICVWGWRVDSGTFDRWLFYFWDPVVNIIYNPGEFLHRLSLLFEELYHLDEKQYRSSRVTIFSQVQYNQYFNLNFLRNWPFINSGFYLSPQSALESCLSDFTCFPLDLCQEWSRWTKWLYSL